MFFRVPTFATDPFSIDEYAGEEISSAVPDELYDPENNDGAGSGFAGPADVLGYLSGIFTGEIKYGVRIFAVLCGSVILCMLLSRLSETTEADSMKTVYTFVSALCIGIVSAGIVTDLWKEVSLILDKLQTLLSAISASIVTVYAVSGNVSQAAANSADLTFVLLTVSGVVKYALYPVLRICMAFGFVGCVSGDFDLSSLSRLIRKSFTVILTLTMGVLTAVLSAQNVIASKADNMLVRGVKMAAGSFIPIVGNAIGEASKTVTAGLDSLKATLGMTCIIAIAATVLPIFIKLLITKFCFALASSFSEISGEAKQSVFLKSCGELFNFCIALLASVTLIFIINLMIFTRSASALSG